MTQRYRLCFPLVGLLVAVAWLLGPKAWAQQPSRASQAPPTSQRCRWLRLAPGRDTTTFALQDTLTIVPSTVQANGRPVGYDARLNRYRYVRPAPAAGRPDSVYLCYRVLPVQLLAQRYRRPRRLMDSLEFRDRKLMRLEDFSQKEQILSTPGISKTGNLARGISFGNTQNVFVNSALNLQLEGKLTETIRLTAAISDQNVPFQPEGNTQTLQQFDKIYITLTGPQWNLTAGDVVLRNKPDYFLRYYKNIQGAAVEANLGAPGPQPLQAGVSNNSVSNAPPSSFTTYTNGVTTNSAAPTGNSLQTLTPPTTVVPPNQTLQTPTGTGAPGTLPAGTGEVTVRDRLGQIRSSTLLAGGVAKGKFASIDLTPLENVQGPYRLTGPNGEQFIIVLAGSERVYLDGRLQTRGFDYDYTIDYNLAEITFSPRHLITKNSRLKVDFEYSDLNYSRSLYTLSHYQQVGRLQLRGNFYQESDDPNSTANLTLTAPDQEALRSAGNVAVVQTPGGDSVAYNRTLVQYSRVVRVNASGQRSYAYSYPPDSTRGVYNVRFTSVGAGQGSYSLSTNYGNTNGRVYEYRGPGQGDYNPVRLLPTPLLKQMATAGATYQLDPTAAVFVDLATSQLQRNRFAIGTEDKGGAMRLGYSVQNRALPQWAPGALRNYHLSSALDYEYTAPKFAPIDRYRDIEFDRNWSATSTANTTTAAAAREDNILNFAVGLTRDATHSLNYRLSRRYRPGEVSGVQHWLDVAQQLGRVEVRGALFVLSSQAGRYQSSWARGEASVRYGGGRIIPGYSYKFDKNRVVSPNRDSVRSANYFDEHTFFLQSPDTGRTRYRFDYSYRQDQTPTAEQTTLRVRNIAQTWQGNVSTRLGRTQDLRVLATYRDVQRVEFPDSARQRNVLGKIDYNVTLLQNQIRSELTYSVQTGRELRRDYSFLGVPAGQGTHYYAGDLNKNGIQDRDEFLEAQTPDAQYRTYIKVYIPTTDYLTAYQNRLSYRLTVNAPRGWREAGGWQALAARLSSITSVTVDRRTSSTSLGSRLSPFSFEKEDASLLAFSQLVRQTFYLNRANPTFGAELTAQQTQQKTLLAQGFDLRNLTTQSLLLRRTLAQSFTGRLTLARDIREAQSTYSANSAFLSARNFRLLIYTIQPEISYQPNAALRFTGTLQHIEKRDVYPHDIQPDLNGTRGTFDDLGLETRLSQVGKRTLTAATHFTRVSFDGNVASVVGLEVLQALRPGSNFTWNLNLEQRLTNGLNITVAYDGRKSSGLEVVHTGRMQVAVLF